MKGFVAISTTTPAKRRWRAPAAVVLVLVFFSLLVPLDFLLGLHDRFPSGESLGGISCCLSFSLRFETSSWNFGHLGGVGSSSEDVTGSDLSKTGDLLNQKPDTHSTGQLVEAGKGTGSNSKAINLNSRSQLENTSTTYKPEVIIPHQKGMQHQILEVFRFHKFPVPIFKDLGENITTKFRL
ncbi:hypothetical protein GW17_00007269 [Ensete ventricosum]|nr:hypothetical protein GW17_00007269 [Ensete ventricosum]